MDDTHGVQMGTLPASHIEGHGDGPDSTDGEEDEDDLHDSAQPFDFDHAVNYVTTIKKRFAGDPETYKAFLDVLHNYQRQREHNGGGRGGEVLFARSIVHYIAIPVH